jgi:hypothetical protein
MSRGRNGRTSSEFREHVDEPAKARLRGWRALQVFVEETASRG